MFSNKYLSSMKYHPLEPLQKIEDEWGLDMPETSEDRIKFLKREFKFLDIFLSLQSFIGEPDMPEITQKVQDLFQDAAVDLRNVNMIQHIDRLTYQVQDKIQIIKCELKAEYSFPKVSASKDGIATAKLVMEFVDTVVGSLGDLVKIYGSSSLLFVPGPKKELEDVLEELELLRNFVYFVSDRCLEPQSQRTFFSHVLLVAAHAGMVAWLYLPSHDNENQDVTPGQMNILLSDLLRMKIKPIQPGVRKIYIKVLQALKSTIQSRWCTNIQIEHAADCEASFVETLQHNMKELPIISNPNWIVAWNDQIAALQEMLNLFMANLIHLSLQDLEFHLQDIDTVMVDVGLLVYSLYDNEEKKEAVLGEANRELPLDLLSTIQHIKRVIYNITRKEFQSNLPRIHGIGYVDFLLNNLKEFQDRYSDSLAFVKTQLYLIQKELESVQPFLLSVAQERHSNDDKLQHSVALLIGKAYEVEYIVDACISKKVPDWCLMLWLLDIIEEIRAEVPKIQQKKMIEVDLALHDTTNTGADHTPLELAPEMNEGIMGFDDVMKQLRNKLTNGPKELDVISITGMPGLGKTTLANRLYVDESVVSHFDVRAQCCVSQVYSRRGLLLSILIMLDVRFDKEKKDNELAVILRQFLYPKRYLILIDDVWETTAWDDLRQSFPDDNKASRIILTTRYSKVAEEARCVSEPYPLRNFNFSESWKLLQSKVFGDKGCSPVLERVGQEIARKCGGLPLSLVLVAGILEKMEKTERCWSQVAEDLGSYIHSDSKAIVEHSYKHLPYHLKPCFVYFGTFLEDEEINVSKLTWLWIGEGFIKDGEGNRLEDIAEAYLENLIRRNLVMDAKRSCDGKVKACRIHDLLLEFCKRRAEEEHLLLWIKRDQKANPSSSICPHKQLVQRRLAFSDADDLVECCSSCSPVGSVLCRRRAYAYTRPVSHIFHNFKFLNVLDMESIVIYSFPAELVYLRYFAAQIAQESITSSMTNLWNLQTLIIKPKEGKLTLPITVWKMVKLRHIHIDNAYFSLNDGKELLENLETLSSPSFSCPKDVELLLRKTPNLRELACSFVDFKDDLFPKLDFPAQLETLEIHLATGSMIDGPCNFPSSLRNLTLSRFSLGSCHESNIANLPQLQVLRLIDIVFDNKEWKVRDDEFPELIDLNVEDCVFFEEWNVSDDALPRLHHLVLRKCQYLKVIPDCFQEISSLKSIEIKWCNKSVEKSGIDILRTKVEDYQISDFRVFIN